MDALPVSPPATAPRHGPVCDWLLRRCAYPWQFCQGTSAHRLWDLPLVASSSRSRTPTSPKLKVSKSSVLQIAGCVLVHNQVSMHTLSLGAASPCAHSCSALCPFCIDAIALFRWQAVLVDALASPDDSNSFEQLFVSCVASAGGLACWERSSRALR